MVLTALLSLLGLAVLPFTLSTSPPWTRSDSIHIPITRRSNRARGLQDLAMAADHLRAKYNFTTRWKGKRAGTVVDVPITNENGDLTYVGAISVGTPAQQFNVILDSGSSDLWLAGTHCTTCPSGTHQYDSTKSSTFANSTGIVTVRYAGGAIEGTLVKDTVSMSGFIVSQQTFLSVRRTTDGIFSGTASGFMGLAFQSIAQTRALPFWQALVNNNLFTSPDISFWLTRSVNNQNAQAAEPGGVMTLGGSNTSLYTGNIEFLPMPSSTSPTYWLLQISSITVQGKNVQIATGNLANAAIDTGTTLIGGPSADVRTIWAKVPGVQALSGNLAGFYSYPCGTQVQVSISFGGASWTINPADMNLGTLNGGTIGAGEQCVGGIFDIGQVTNAPTGGGNPNWIIGDTFLKNVYTVLRSNPPSIGFAQLSAAAGGSPTTSVLTSFSPSATPATGTVHGSSPSGTGSSSSSSSGAVSVRATDVNVISTLLRIALVVCILVHC